MGMNCVGTGIETPSTTTWERDWCDDVVEAGLTGVSRRTEIRTRLEPRAAADKAEIAAVTLGGRSGSTGVLVTSMSGGAVRRAKDRDAFGCQEHERRRLLRL
jgi:hypothetical protein